MSISDEEVKKELQTPLSSIESELNSVYLRHQATIVTPTGKIRKPRFLDSKTLRKKIIDGLADSEVKNIICVNLEYCKNKESQTVKIIIDIADSIVVAHSFLLTSFPVPAVRIIAYALRVGILDDLCECEKTKKK